MGINRQPLRQLSINLYICLCRLGTNTKNEPQVFLEIMDALISVCLENPFYFLFDKGYLSLGFFLNRVRWRYCLQACLCTKTCLYTLKKP